MMHSLPLGGQTKECGDRIMTKNEPEMRPRGRPAAAEVRKEGEGTWGCAESTELYRVDQWGEGFFRVGETGRLTVHTGGDGGHVIDVFDVVTGLGDRGISTPVMIGFPELVERRMDDMASVFAEAIGESGYKAGYTAVYPIKVNQHRHLVRQIEDHGRRRGFGLEVGSKPELLAVMALTADSDDRLIVCNGFKERRYIHHIMLATKLGRRAVAVIENLDELELIIEESVAAGVRPHIGVRLKLDTPSTGRWRDSTGEKAKFGLTFPGILLVVDRLTEAGMLDCLELLHCHMGSQISDIQVVNTGLSELTRVFVELQKMGAKLGYIDVGGGLGIDYDGSQTNSDFSVNYSLQEYASTVVYRIQSICDDAGIDHPTIVTETGRAMVGHHSVLVFDVLGSNRLDRWALDPEEASRAVEAVGAPRVLRDLCDAYLSVAPDRLLEAYHDALQAREEGLTHFGVGLLDLKQRGLIDRLFWSTCLEIARLAADLDPMPEELEELQLRISDTYFCNLSVFQSLPDSWALEQIFPIMPIHRLDQEPRRRATLVDITCDSDGRIDRFIDEFDDTAPVLAVHDLRAGERYFLAVFLVGAYQETLGDLHNLFGDTNLVQIRSDGDGGWNLEEVVVGDTVAEVLSYLEYDPRTLIEAMRRDCEIAVRSGRLSVAESREVLQSYEAGLAGSTYLEA
jgi:arginine decarboxylase